MYGSNVVNAVNETAGDTPTETTSGSPIDKSLVLDDLDEKFRAFQAFRKSDSAATESILDALGAQDDVDRDIILELSSGRPLGHPERFAEAHALAVRALEVLDRNGARGVRVSGLGPLSPVAAYLIQQVAQFIVRNYQSSVVDSMTWLYARREANARLDDPARPMLTRARIHMMRLAPGFKRNPLGIPTFLLGGAVISTLLQVVVSLASSALGSLLTRAIATVFLGLLIAGAAWIILRGAAVARRRIRLTTDPPLQALWETIGRCGGPPRDQSRTIAMIAILLTFIPWVLIPLGLLGGWLIK
jgi:hypothetical protein